MAGEEDHYIIVTGARAFDGDFDGGRRSAIDGGNGLFTRDATKGSRAIGSRCVHSILFWKNEEDGDRLVMMLWCGVRAVMLWCDEREARGVLWASTSI